MIDARVSWFYEWMGEGNADTAHWDKERGGDEQAVYEAAELVAMFEKTWHVISSAMTRWTCADVDAQHYRELTEQLYHTLVANMKKEQS